MVACTCNPNTQKAEAGRLQVQSQPEIETLSPKIKDRGCMSAERWSGMNKALGLNPGHGGAWGKTTSMDIHSLNIHVHLYIKTYTSCKWVGVVSGDILTLVVAYSKT